MNKFPINSIVILTLVTSVFIPPSQAKAAYPSTYTVDGYIERIEGGAIWGWVYRGDQPVELLISLQDTASDEYVTYVISNMQQSNKIAYWSQRDDIKNYLTDKYGATLSYDNFQGFHLNGQYLPEGSWRVTSVSLRDSSQNLPIISANKTLYIESSVPYEEGYIDSTIESGAIKGWAYSSEAYAADYGPKITVTVKKVGTNETKSFTLPRGKEQEGFMIRTQRQDVTAFLLVGRAQPASWFATPNTNRNFTGFTFAYNQAPDHPNPPLSAGQWQIESVMADNFPVVYGNTNPSQVITVQ